MIYRFVLFSPKASFFPFFFADRAPRKLRIATHFESTGRIPVTPVSLPFWQNVYPSAKSGQTYRAGDGVFEQTLAQLKLWADGFLTIGQEFQGPDGSFTEQFSRSVHVFFLCPALE